MRPVKELQGFMTGVLSGFGRCVTDDHNEEPKARVEDGLLMVGGGPCGGGPLGYVAVPIGNMEGFCEAYAAAVPSLPFPGVWSRQGDELVLLLETGPLWYPLPDETDVVASLEDAVALVAAGFDAMMEAGTWSVDIPLPSLPDAVGSLSVEHYGQMCLPAPNTLSISGGVATLVIQFDAC